MNSGGPQKARKQTASHRVVRGAPFTQAHGTGKPRAPRNPPYQPCNQSQAVMTSSANKVGGRFVVCEICGRDFTAASIPIHKPQCIDKFEREQAKLPKNQRRPLPQPPSLDAAGATLTQEQYNEAAYKQFMDSGRTPCPNCARGFVGTALEIHLRSCKPGGHFAKQSQQAKLPTAAPPTRPKSAVPPPPVSPSHKLSPASPSPVSPSQKLPNKASPSPQNQAVPNPRPSTAKADDSNSAKLPPDQHSKFCGECGEQFGDSDKFCRGCGTRRA
ncbi:hypothetical protein SeMB42_g06230 [Synchytrium endobioticum]|uniref:C2HC/C3H-type domain-containing protein n=1 Tax=Synchytrium endobioticum TaxID=286115 RepID=A0A507CMK0_9FUNG|nr:hypothetical protein SeMB42_g06230 [Synchytrium endobioticum]TPX41355.1 hypothetical protein SeLEV6574_g06132 [Synchytrium endobioticum]